MSFYRHNNTGKYFIILESQLERIPTEPNRGDDIIEPYRKEVSETVGVNSENANDFFPISRNFYEASNEGAEDPLSVVPEFQATLIKTIASEEAKTSLETTSNSNMLGFRIKKGKLSIEPSDPNWPTLLNQLSTDPENSLINKSVSNLLADNNLNSPSNPYANNPVFFENDIVLGTVQNKTLGEHGPRKFPDVVEVDKKNQVSIGDMKTLGVNLLLASTGGVPIQVLSSEITEEAQKLSLVDSGFKVNFGAMKPSTVLSLVKPGYLNLDNNDSVFDNSFLVDSYGNPNNPFKPFMGTKSQVSSPVLFAKILALSLALKSIIERFNIYGKTLGDHLTDGTTRDKQTFMGSNLGNQGSDEMAEALDPFDTPPIKNDFYSSVEAGFRQFFGLSENYRVQVDGKHAGQHSKMYGYISIFARKLNAAINELNLGAIYNLANTITGQNFTSDPGGAVNNALKLYTNSEPAKTAEEEVEKLRSNFAIKFIKILSIIGDKVLTVEGYNQQVPVPGIGGYLSDIDNMRENIASYGIDVPTTDRLNPAVLVVKHKLDSRDGGLAYGNNTTPSLLLLPEAIRNGAKELTGEDPYAKLDLNLRRTNEIITNPASGDRISQEAVKQMEDYLEMDYMPFYFHDLRTNEIISFHAFLESATDNLSAEYNETEGYGRTGVIPVYKNTKRSINFTFKILATNQDDHEQMWYKVNRLAACLYPQFSEGRLLTYEGNKFIQPFSQVFAASPLMRIRFGDLWKSNYSKFAVARLFGLAGINQGERSTFELASTRRISARAPTDRVRQRQQERNASTQAPRELQVGDRVQIKATATKYTWAAASRDNNFMGDPPAQIRQRQRNIVRIGQYIMDPNHFLYIPTGTNYVIGQIDSIHRGRVSINYFVKILNASPNGVLNGFIVQGNKRSWAPPAGNGNPGDDPTNWVICVNPGALSRVLPPPEPEITDPVVATEAVNNSVPEFFRCDGDDPNPIMKAFCSTEGKGLACVIREMNLEGLMDVPWAVERFDGRAPQLLTVTMEITPIHDISPGLDSRGFMTAPVWPTGTMINNMMGKAASSTEGEVNFVRSRSRYFFSAHNKLGA